MKIWKNSKLKVDTCITAGLVCNSQLANLKLVCYLLQTRCHKTPAFLSTPTPCPQLTHDVFHRCAPQERAQGQVTTHLCCCRSAVNICVNVSRDSQNSKLALSSLHGKCRRILHVFMCGYLKRFVSAAILSLWLFIPRALNWEETCCKAMHDCLHNNSVISE